MKGKNKSVYTFFAPLVISCIFLLIVKSINAQEEENEREFDYGAKSGKGPRKWGSIKKEWSACNNGNLQSPVNMLNERVKIISKPDQMIYRYRPANATLKNRGHDIEILWLGGAGSLFINGTEYPLQNAHWHSSSEHTINGKRYDMELHLVHMNKDPKVKNKIAVVGIFYNIGKPDGFLSKLMGNVSSIIDKKDQESALGMVDPNEIKSSSRSYYRYIGSLTVPPCTEGVIWTLYKEVRTVSREQVKLLREAVHDYAEENARPMQNLNNRAIYLYGPGATN